MLISSMTGARALIRWRSMVWGASAIIVLFSLFAKIRIFFGYLQKFA
jgi:hypothetical protein